MRIDFSIKVGNVGDTVSVGPVIPPDINIVLEGEAEELLPYFVKLLNGLEIQA